MADGKITIDTSIDNAGALKDLKKLTSNVSQQGNAAAGAASSAFSKIGSAAKHSAEIAVTALAGVGTAITVAGGFAVKVGSDFEAAMSKVAAVSGATGTDLSKLTEKAKEMGAKTKFSASEAAEAMNYMAMAGWKTEEMLNGVEGIMNLAAASGEDLASTSDIVTDALSSFGLQASDSGHFADILAAASSNANTNVAMMGETFKYAASVAGAMGYTAEDTALAIGLMANRGIKAGQAGTALRSIMTRLAKPTKETQGAMNKLGISLTDSEGNMKSLDTIMQDLREGFSGLSEEEKAATASALGGQEAMSGLLAIVGASPEEYEKLQSAIENCDGTAERMAETMLDNLQGSLTILKSSLEGLGIEVYESMQEPLKNAADNGIADVNRLTEAFKQGGFDAAVEEAGDILAGLATKVAQSAPKMIDASVFVVKSFVKGIGKNKMQLKVAANDIVKSLCDGLVKLLPKEIQKPAKKALDSLVRTFKTGMKSAATVVKNVIDIIGTLFKKLGGNMDTVIPAIASIVVAFKTFKAVTGPVSTVVSVITKLSGAAKGAGIATAALNAIMSANPATLIAGAIAVLVGGLATYALTAGRADEQQNAFNERMDKLGASIEKNQNAIDQLGESMKDTSASIEASAAPVERLRGKLSEAFDETGHVKEGCEDLATSILNQLNEAMGTSYHITADGFISDNDEVKQSLQDINTTIDEYVENLKRKSYSEAAADDYVEATKRQKEAQADLIKVQKEYREGFDKLIETGEKWNSTRSLGDYKEYIAAQENLKKTTEELENATQAAAETDAQVKGLDQVLDYLADGTPESMQKAIDSYSNLGTEASKTAEGIAVSEQMIQDALSSTDYSKMTQGFQLAVMQIEQSGGEIPKSLQESIVQAVNNFDKLGTEGKESVANSMRIMMEAMKGEVPEFVGVANQTSDKVVQTFGEYLVNSGALGDVGTEAIEKMMDSMDSADTTSVPKRKGRETTQTAAQSIEEGYGVLRTASQGAGNQVGQGFSDADYSTAVFWAAKVCGMTVDEMMAHTDELYTVAAQVAQSGGNGFTSADLVGIFGSNTDAAVEAANNCLLNGLPQASANGAALGNSANAGILSSNMSMVFGTNAQAATDIANFTLMNGAAQAGASGANFGNSTNAALMASNMPGVFAGQANGATSNFAFGMLSGAGQGAAAASSVGSSAGMALQNSGISSMFQTTGTNATNILNSTIKGSQGTISSATKNLGRSSASALKGVNLGSNFQSQARSAVNMFCAGIRGITSSAISAARALGTGTIRGLSECNLSTEGRTQGSKFARSFSEGIDSGRSSASTAASGLGSDAENSLSGYSGSGYNVGAQFSAGFASGIRSGEYEVTAAAAYVANQAVAAAKRNLKTASPSRVMRAIGRWYDKGLEVGIQENTRGVEKAVDRLSDKLTFDPNSLLAKMRGDFDNNLSRIAGNHLANRYIATVTAPEPQEPAKVEQTVNIYQPVKSPVETARELRKVGRELAFG